MSLKTTIISLGGIFYMNAQAYAPVTTAHKKRMSFVKKKNQMAPEDIFILTTLERLKKDLDNIHSSLNSVTDPTLIDSFIFEMNALHMRYKFYLQVCKEKGLVNTCLD